jgi:hypothetical protein
MEHTLEITSGEIVVSDPCYTETETGPHVSVLKAKNGTWKFWVEHEDGGSWGNRVSALCGQHGSSPGNAYYHVQNVSVDSGQMSVSDLDFFKAHISEREYGTEDFYGSICDITINESSNAGKYGQTFASSSGYGDGSYPLYVDSNKYNEVTAIRVVFIDDCDYDDEYDDEDY